MPASAPAIATRTYGSRFGGSVVAFLFSRGVRFNCEHQDPLVIVTCSADALDLAEARAVASAQAVLDSLAARGIGK